jgi:secernin
MCDTLIALSNSTDDGSVLFGKNSDRPREEIQLVTYAPKGKYPKEATLKCTYITIPQVSETNAVLLNQPWWMWGAESGANEFGVVIGNEAVYSYEPLRKKGLLGMDLLRLGLERGKNAKESMKVIIELLEKYHQGGGCSYNDPSWTYHNSFIIADPEEAFILETVDDWWIVEKVKDIKSISNELTIRGKGDMRRDGIIQHAIEKNYCKDERDFDFAFTFSGSIPSNSPFSRGGRLHLLLNENKGDLNLQMMMKFLRDHQAGICMHGGFESTGSQISQLRKDKKAIHWITGTSLPCQSIYKPYIFPIIDQKYVRPGPYKKINSDWPWYQYNKFRGSLRLDRLRNIEQSIIYKKRKFLINSLIVK